MFQDLDVYRTGALSSLHPTKSYHWRPRGCIDEIVILSLEKSYSHGPMEHAARSCPGVAAAIGVGQMKPTLGHHRVGADAVLYEVHYAVQRTIDTLQTDRQSLKWVQLNRIVRAPSRKSLLRSAKGFVCRKDVLKQCRDEIELVILLLHLTIKPEWTM